MGTFAVTEGGVLLNVRAFCVINAVFSLGSDDERKRQDKTIEQQETDREQLSRKRTQILDWINEKIRRYSNANSFKEVDATMEEYHALFLNDRDTLGKQHTLSNYYALADDLKTNELTAIAMCMGITTFTSQKVGKI